MYVINGVELDFEPRKQILPKILTFPSEPEMTEWESAYLCGLIKSVRPKKLLEIGVAGGGTTAIILQCMENLYRDYEMHSIDVNTQFYMSPNIEAGAIAQYAIRLLRPEKHYFHLGGTIAQYIDEIGDGIDFVILDTTHRIPGEILDFLICLPHLSDNAVVCLHDVVTSQGSPIASHFFGTAVLFGAVTGEKYLNFMPQDFAMYGRYVANIAAFKVTAETRKEILDIFEVLLLPWQFIPDMKNLDEYTERIHMMYDETACAIYDAAINLNLLNYGILKNVLKFTPSNSPKILLYGAGMRGKRLYHELKELQMGFVIDKWVDRNARNIKSVDGVEILEPDDVEAMDAIDYAVIALTDSTEIKKVQGYLVEKGMKPSHVLVFQMWG